MESHGQTFAAQPWGRTSWVFDRLGSDPWHFIGCVGTEDRSIALVSTLASRIETWDFTQVVELPEHEKAEEVSRRRGRNLQTLQRQLAGHQEPAIAAVGLLERAEHLVARVKGATHENARRVILDITAFPKRFFFLYLATLIRDNGIDDLIVTYTHAAQYGSGPLSSQVEPAEFLPMFLPGIVAKKDPATLVVGLGFETLGLFQVTEQTVGSDVAVMMPLPAPPPYFSRNWDFYRQFSEAAADPAVSMVGVSHVDVPAIFRRLTALGRKSPGPVRLAPYGPKSVSLAMCLYALAVGRDKAAVIYTQPKFYSPDYSSGFREDDQGIVSYAYPVKLAGRPVYGLAA